MEIEADKETLVEDLNRTIDQLFKWKNSEKRKTNFVAVYGGLVSALTTVLIGLASYLQEYATQFQVLALLTSSSLTVVAAWDSLFRHKKLWVIQASVLHKFYELRNDIKHMEKSKQLTAEVVNQFYIRYKEIYGSLNQKWIDLRGDS